ncbi:MAG: thiamine phosphate synthase [Pseudomonadota bacterium]
MTAAATTKPIHPERHAMPAAPNHIAGLYAVTPDEPDTRVLAAKVGAALAGGAKLVQYRNKTAAAALRAEQAATLQNLCRRHRVPLIINDHLELALEIGADGLHLGGDDGSIAAARTRLGPHKILGASCYNVLDKALRAWREGADYVAFGSFFASEVKPGAVRAPLGLLTEAKRSVPIPVIAIGGITLENAPQLITAGADALGVISAVFAAPDVGAAAKQFSRLFFHKAATR